MYTVLNVIVIGPAMLCQPSNDLIQTIKHMFPFVWISCELHGGATLRDFYLAVI